MQQLLDIEKPVFPTEPKTEIGSRLLTKTGWQPSVMQPHETTELSFNRDQIIRKCLALGLELEIPVGEFALEGEKKLSGQEEYSTALKSNAHDENVHYTGLSYAADSYLVQASEIEEANQITKAFLEMDHVHPIYMAGYIELSLFMPVLTMLRNYGNSILKLLSRDITRDEGVHVFTNWTLIDELGINVSQDVAAKLTSLRLEVIKWILQDSNDTRRDLDYWLKQSDDLINTRKAPDLDWTRTGQYVALFELPNSVSKY